ncbi:MAG: hypothetical protein LBK13_06325, partial [Spirochaetales bacterium]|nr:hypothetical protein [Spirochaetales bacterium]
MNIDRLRRVRFFRGLRLFACFFAAGVLLARCTSAPPPLPPPEEEQPPGAVVVVEEIPSLFVSPKGSDSAGGFTRQTALRSLDAALNAVGESGIKRIVILGRLSAESEALRAYPRGEASVFFISNTGAEEILITGEGETGAGEEEAALCADGTEKKVITISGESRVRFENITISGGSALVPDIPGGIGGGLYIDEGAQVTLGAGTRVVSNTAVFGAGAAVWTDGRLVLEDGADIRDNYTSAFTYMAMQASPSGGGVFVSRLGELVMRGGEISGNRAYSSGGGVSVENSGRFT